MIGGAKRSSSRTCNEAVRGDIGLQGRRNKAKLKK